MGTSTDQIRQELTETREDLDQKIDTMESRLASSVRRYRRYLPAAGGGAAALGLAAFAILFARSRRHPTLLEQVARAVTVPMGRARDGLRGRIPAVRIAVGDAAFADERGRGPSRWQQIGLRLAQAAGTAGGSAAVGYAVRRVRPRRPGQGKGEEQ